MAPSSVQIVVPTAVVGPADVQRMQREIEELDEFLRQAAIRKAGESLKMPKTTEGLEALAEANKLNLLQPSDRKHAAELLQQITDKAPVLHLSFAADPSPAFTAKIVSWLRENIHPLVLVHLGLQPSIAAGCTVRTTNKYFDFSLRQHLLANRQLLIDALAKLNVPQQVAQPQPTPIPQSATPQAGGQQ